MAEHLVDRWSWVEKMCDSVAAVAREQRDAAAFAIAARCEARALGALRAAAEALAATPAECRYHGTNFHKLGMVQGRPRCESCRLPYLVTVARMNVQAELGAENVPWE